MQIIQIMITNKQINHRKYPKNFKNNNIKIALKNI